MLEGARVLDWCFSAVEATRALSAGRSAIPARDGLAVPPPRLRVRVAGTAEPEWFLESGRTTAETIRDAALRHGLNLADPQRLLDFGCGSGRVTRHWPAIGPVDVDGSDIDAPAVAWCAEHLTFGRFAHHGLEPALPYADETFDLAYAVSVFTHLPAELQLPWAAELRRVLRPGGLLVLSLHGDAYLDRLAPREDDDYRAGRLVVRRPSSAGRNLCSTFHPREYVGSTLAGGFELLEHISNGMAGTPHQDLVVLRKPPAA